jgi:hypothetical protein
LAAPLSPPPPPATSKYVPVYAVIAGGGNTPICSPPPPIYCTNGVDVLYVTVPLLVILKLFELLSVMYVAELATVNNNDVLVPVVNVVVGTEKLPVYTARPLTMRRLETYPLTP